MDSRNRALLVGIIGLASGVAIATAVGCGDSSSDEVVGVDGGDEASTTPTNDAGSGVDVDVPDTATPADAGSDVVDAQAPIDSGIATCTSTADGGCECDGGQCGCAAGQTCNFGQVDGGDGGTSNTVYDCNSNNTCNVQCTSGCTTSCAGSSSCNQTCQSGCTSTCAGGAICAIEAGVDSGITCTGGASCNVDLGASSTLTCAGNTTCNVKCPSTGCTLNCSDHAAKCTFTCGEGDGGADGGAGDAGCPYTCTAGSTRICPVGSTCTCADAGH
ncbi:MAG: hypothetical protein U0235_26285 [Polyangiaceae bacterium]